MEKQNTPVSNKYFLNKKSQSRKKVADTSGQAFEALEIATQVLRLCYPLRALGAVHCYYNNSKFEPFVAHEQGGKAPVKNYIVVDIYFFFEGEAYGTKTEDDAFAVEVAFPQNVERARWHIARVRWADLGWRLRGNHRGDTPVPQLVGETIVSHWM